MILAIDTATNFAGLALYNQDALWAEEVWLATRNHSVTLLPRLAQMLENAQLNVAQLEAIAVAIGPGSYTGVRVGVSLAKGLALPHNLSVIGVPTLAITAYPLQDQSLPIVAVAQAGRNRLLVARYRPANDETALQEIEAPSLNTLSQLIASLTQPALVVGELNAEQRAKIRKEAPAKIQLAGALHHPRRPGALAALAAQKLANHEVDDIDRLVPVYIKGP